MGIKIGIDAEFNDADVQKQIDSINAQFQKLGESVAKSSKTKFNPISLKDKEDLKYFVQMSEKLLKIQGGMASQMKKSGQGSKNPLFANWGQMYLNEQTRQKRMQEMLVFYGNEFTKPPATPPANVPGGRVGTDVPYNPWWKQGRRILNTGAQSFGPMGNIFAGAVNDGAAGGVGAGMAGLLGGVAALGIGKLISGVMSKVGDAQTEAIMTDKLMRRLGGGTSFDALRSGIRLSANDLGMNINATQSMADRYTRLADTKADEAGNLPGELTTAGGWARGFGLAPEEGANFFGQMRGMRVTNSDQDARKLGVLIGETIARSDAFSKSDEVLQAISSFVDTQTRLSLSAPNVAGYTGEFSALTGSGAPGLDPAGTANLLSRANSALMGGGAKGEASQFLTSMVANRMGMDPMQMAIFKEGGAFATGDQMFGAGSMASRFGVKGPTGDQTFLSATLDTLREKYKGQNPGMLAMATANHLGTGINQAMALLSIDPNRMGSIQGNLNRLNVDMGSLDASGIHDISDIAGASGKGLQTIAGRMMKRTGKGALSTDEAQRLAGAMADADKSGDTTKLRDLLTVMAAQKGQVETEGSKTRDTIAKVDNTMQEYASKSLPLLNDARAALLFLAGKQGAGGPRALRQWALDSEHDENMSAIEAKYPKAAEAWKKMMEHPTTGALSGSMVGGTDKAAGDLQAEWVKEAKPLVDEQAKETARYKSASANLDQASVDDYNANQAAQQNAGDGTSSPATANKPNVGYVQQIESGGRDFDKSGGYLTSGKGAKGSMQVMPGTLKDPGFGVLPARNNTPGEYKRVGVDYLNAMYNRYGDTDKALAAYNWGPGKLDRDIAKYGRQWADHLPAETRAYLRKYHAMEVDRSDKGGFSAASAYNVSVSGEGTMGLDLTDEAKRLLRPTSMPQVRFGAATPAGG